MNLSEKRCVPCEGGVPPMEDEEADRLLPQVPGWEREGNKIFREHKFKDFKETMSYVNKVADVAEQEQHHPDLNIYGWNHLRITTYTHAIGGLSENDFILAAKINKINP